MKVKEQVETEELKQARQALADLDGGVPPHRPPARLGPGVAVDRRRLLQGTAAWLVARPLTAAASGVTVVLRTSLGDVEIEVDAARAPVTAANFLRYVDGGYYDGGRFHRTVRLDNQPGKTVLIEVVQAGVNPTPARPGFEPIRLERTRDTGLRHRDGTVSMARAEPDSATSDFFVCIGDQPELDFGGKRNPDGQGFAAFGRVVRGWTSCAASSWRRRTARRSPRPFPSCPPGLARGRSRPRSATSLRHGR